MRHTRKIPAGTIKWILSGEPWIRYAAMSAIPGLSGSNGELEEARRDSVSSPLLAGLAKELGSWPGKPLASHKSAEQLFHRLSLAAELGLRDGDPGARSVVKSIMSRVSPEGPFTLPAAISKAHGGTGEEIEGWALCDAPVILRALVRMGLGGDSRVVKAVAHLVSLSFDRGWPCATSANLGFRGPGRKADPCPYATLVMIELLLELPEYCGSAEVRRGAETLLQLWERSREEHPYIFWMGDDFRKLKAPLLWYDLLHVLCVLTKVEAVTKDSRLAEMLDLLESMADETMLFTPGSVYQAWKGFDFGQKKEPSAYITTIALGILARTGRVSMP